MRKLFFILLSAIMIARVYIPVHAAAEVYADTSYFFYGGISEMTYDGSVFVALKGDKLASSVDFQNWEFVDELFTESFYALEYFNGEFICIGKQITAKSQDGVNWTKYKNNLNAPVSNRKCVANSKVLLASISEYGYIDGEYTVTESGTYSSMDGVDWERVPNVPDGADISVVNDKLVIVSRDYMKGIYVSDDGLKFDKLDADGDYLRGLIYVDGSYFIYGNDSVYGTYHHFLLKSTNLISWEKEILADSILFPFNAVYVNIDGIEHYYLSDGSGMVYRDNKWQYGNKHMPDYRSYRDIHCYYNATLYGLLVWTNFGDAYFYKNYEEWIYTDRHGDLNGIESIDGLFYSVHYTPNKEVRFKSSDGLNWDRVETIPADDGGVEGEMTVTNGDISIKYNNFYKWKNWVADNQLLPAEITVKNGNASTVLYEDGHLDILDMKAAAGLFFMSGGKNGKVYFSYDGISRYEYTVKTGSEEGSEYISYFAGEVNDNFMVYMGVNNVMHSVSLDQFTNIPIDPTVRIRLNDAYLSFSAPPVIENEDIFIPARFLFERAGAEYKWVSGGINITYDEKVIEISMNSKTAKINGADIQMDVPAKLINEKAFIPLSFLSEVLGFDISYDEDINTIDIKNDN